MQEIRDWVSKHKDKIRSITGVIPIRLLGCGAFGYAYRTNDPYKVLKITEHRSEAKTVASIMRIREEQGPELFPSIARFYHISHIRITPTTSTPSGRQICSPPQTAFLIVREYVRNGRFTYRSNYQTDLFRMTISDLKLHGIHIWDLHEENVGVAIRGFGKRRKGETVLYDTAATCFSGKVTIPSYGRIR